MKSSNYALSLRERKEKVVNELKNINLTTEQLHDLLSLDNTNEQLIFRYICSLNEFIGSQPSNNKSNCPNFTGIPEGIETNIVEEEILNYSNYISIGKLKELKQKIFGNSIKGFRNISYKEILLAIFVSLKEDNTKNLEKYLNILNISILSRRWNNQPYDIDNFEGLYFFICIIFSIRIKNEINKNKKVEYFRNLKLLISKLNVIDEYLKNEKNENEKKDFKKFLRILFALLNLDSDNYNEISQIAMVLKTPDYEQIRRMISFTEEEIKSRYTNEIAEEFMKKIEGNKNFFSLQYNYNGNEIELLEESYLYDYIIQNNIFKKYEKEIISLLDIIYKSDLIKQLLILVYGEDFEKLEPILKKEYSVKNFWDNVIIFVPFKMKRISGFSYRELFKIFISIYKLKHFQTNIENEIFTLGSFVRILIHESLGHFIVSYIFFMFYANIQNRKEYYNSPRIEEKIKNLNKKNYIELIGNTLAKIEFKIIDQIREIESTKFYENLEARLFEEFKGVIGIEYAKILSQKLTESKKKEEEIQVNILKDKSKIYELKGNSTIHCSEENEDNILSKKSEEIINILFQCISNDFDNIIKDLNYRQEAYKSIESGNTIELLLFNDFGQNMTLKECLFLLNEENYKDTNIFKFRSEFKSIVGKKNKDFLEHLNEGNKIFNNLFLQYHLIYKKDEKTKIDFNIPQNFREDSNINLAKKYDSFQCFNIKIDHSLLQREPNSKD